MDTKDITNFRSAITQLTKLKSVLEKLHVDYVKMVSQGKTMSDELEKYKLSNETMKK